MKIRALYQGRTLSVLRRVIVPLSTIATRGIHQVTMLETPEFDPGLGLAQDLVILPDWILERDQLPLLAHLCRETTVCYDLSDPGLLQVKQVQELLPLVSFVTVPNQHLAQEVGSLGKRVRVLPSVLDVPSFMAAHKLPRPTRQVVGCFGPYDWELVRESVQEIKTARPRLVFLAGPEAADVLGRELCSEVTLDPVTYPMLLGTCLFGLLPAGQSDGRDTIWAHEYGILSKPVIASARGAVAHVLRRDGALMIENTKEFWTASMRDLLAHREKRVALGNNALEQAKLFTGPRLAGRFLHVYQKLTPLAMPR